MPVLVAAWLLGQAQKAGLLEKIPRVGNFGPITSAGVIGWGLEKFGVIKSSPLLHDAITSALAITAFNHGLTGTVVGEGEEFAYAMPGVPGYTFPGGAVVY